MGARAVRAAFATVVVAAAATGASGAVAPPTGDANAIDLYHRQAQAYSELPGTRIVETGYFFVRRGAGTAVDYWWGRRPPAGYVPAKATILVRLAAGRIVAYLAVLKGPKVRRVRVLMAGGRVYSATTSCWRRMSATASPLGTGGSYVFNDGGAHFEASLGSTVTFTYDWARGATAVETNRFHGKAPAPVVVTVAVHGSQSLSIRKTISPLRKAPRLPVPGPPRKPVPKPLCL